MFTPQTVCMPEPSALRHERYMVTSHTFSKGGKCNIKSFSLCKREIWFYRIRVKDSVRTQNAKKQNAKKQNACYFVSIHFLT